MGQEVKVVALGEPTLPLSERWPPSHPHQDPHLPQDFPKVLVVGLWGCMQLLESNLPAEILHELSQLIIHKIPKVGLQLVWGLPTQVGVNRGKWGSSSPIGGWRLGAGRFSIYHCYIGPHMGGRRWEVLTLMASSCNINAFMTPCSVTCSSSAVWNSMTDSTAEYRSTTLECVCPNQMQISMTSSSWMEEHETECHHPWLIQKCTYNWRGQLHHLEYNLWLPRWFLWKWWTLQWSERGFVKISTVDSEKSAGYHKWRWNQQISEW